MPRYIIAFGLSSDVREIESPSLEAALAVAVQRTKDEGVEEEMIADCAWAEPYSEELAHEVGLQPYEYAD